MKISVVSDGFNTMSGKQAVRGFLLFDAPEGQQLRLARYFDLGEGHPTYHDLHDDDSSCLPPDGMVLITN